MGNFTCFASAATLAGVLFAAGPAAADSSQLLGTFQNWSAYTNGSGAQKTCYVLSQPQTSLPKKAKRDPIYFLISDWPGRRAKNEAEIVPGYRFKEGSSVTAEVGKQKFTFFTKNDTDDGTAWVQDLSDEAKLVDAMTQGGDVVVSGESLRGTETKDTYALGGLEQALDRIHSTCGM
jgi:Invasion associated locus B (IalB) protein